MLLNGHGLSWRGKQASPIALRPSNGCRTQKPGKHPHRLIQNRTKHAGPLGIGCPDLI